MKKKTLLIVPLLISTLLGCRVLLNKPDIGEGPVVANPSMKPAIIVASKSVKTVTPSTPKRVTKDGLRLLHSGMLTTTSDHKNIFDGDLEEYKFVGPGCTGAQLWKVMDDEPPLTVLLPNADCRLLNLSTGEKFQLIGPFQR